MFLGELLLGLGAIYFSPMQVLFDTGWLPLGSVFAPIGAFVAICLIDEVRKLAMRMLEERASAAAE